MNFQIIKRPKAKKDLDDLAFYIAQDSPKAGFRFLTAAEKAFEKLARMPHLGGIWENPNPDLGGIRVWPIRGFEKYLVFYRPVGEGIEIIRVLHGSREIERALET